jgi:polysaccharide biosynthesis protein PslH
MSERKILIVTNRVPYPLKDGGNLAMQAMIEGYYRSGWQVYLLAMNTSRHHVGHDQLQKLFTHLYAFEWVDIDNKLKTLDILKNYLFSTQPEHARRFYSEVFKEKLKEILTTFKPQVVQMESVYLSTYLPTVKKYSYALTVLRMHNVEYQVWQGVATKTRNHLKQLYLNSLTERIRNFERDAWKQYDLLLPITEKDSYLVTRLEDVNDMIIAPFSIDTTLIRPNPANERWVGYHIGAMDWLPNQDAINWFLSKAWPKVHSAAPKFEFYFAGRHMPKEFTRMNIPGVHCVEEVADAHQFIADKKILIVPLWSGGGVRVKILEAMAAGKIVITTSKGIKGIDAKPGEHFLLAQKPEDFARSVKWCLDNKQLAEEMAQNAYHLVKERYDYNKVIKTVIDEVELLLTSHKR